MRRDQVRAYLYDPARVPCSIGCRGWVVFEGDPLWCGSCAQLNDMGHENLNPMDLHQLGEVMLIVRMDMALVDAERAYTEARERWVTAHADQDNKNRVC